MINPHVSYILKEMWHAGQVLLTLIGGATVVRGFVVYWKWRQENFEDIALGMFEEDNHGMPFSAKSIHNRYLKEVLRDVPMWVVFPLHPKGWPRTKWLLRTIPYQVRHFWRMRFFMPTEKKVQKTILRLWKRGLITRVQGDLKRYRLRL